jgi:GntR family transcriptional regulator, transcriptional repressor for pyruvate dehydrogenase complex
MVQRLAHPRRLRLGDQVAGLLLAAIRLHEYLPGQRLPSERELCLRFGVNRMAVREGLRWLEGQQYIEIRRGKYGGAFVRQPGRELALERVRSRAEQLRQLFEYRSVVEPLGCSLAAERITSSELERLGSLMATEEAEPVRAKRRAMDEEIHQIIADSARNDYFSRAVREIRIQLALGLDLLQSSPGRNRESHLEHRRILKALAAGDGSAARLAMQRHVLSTEREIRRALVELGVRAEFDNWPATPEPGADMARLSESEIGRSG